MNAVTHLAVVLVCMVGALTGLVTFAVGVHCLGNTLVHRYVDDTVGRCIVYYVP